MIDTSELLRGSKIENSFCSIWKVLMLVFFSFTCSLTVFPWRFDMFESVLCCYIFFYIRLRYFLFVWTHVPVCLYPYLQMTLVCVSSSIKTGQLWAITCSQHTKLCVFGVVVFNVHPWELLCRLYWQGWLKRKTKNVFYWLLCYSFLFVL